MYHDPVEATKTSDDSDLEITAQHVMAKLPRNRVTDTLRICMVDALCDQGKLQLAVSLMCSNGHGSQDAADYAGQSALEAAYGVKARDRMVESYIKMSTWETTTNFSTAVGASFNPRNTGQNSWEDAVEKDSDCLEEWLCTVARVQVALYECVLKEEDNKW
jgi:hypothetical protein